MTKRTWADIASRAPVNTTGLISSQDFNDLLDSVVPRIATANISGAASFNFNDGNVAILTLTGNVTSFSISNGVEGLTLRLCLKQDATGSRTFTGATGILWEGSAPPTLTTTPSRMDVFDLQFDGTNWLQVATASMNVGG